MALKKTNKRQAELTKILVASSDTALQSTGSLAAAGTTVNIADGKLGMLCWDFNSSLEPIGDWCANTATAANVAAVKVIQGTPNSTNLTAVNPFEVNDPAFVESAVIRRDKIVGFSASFYNPGNYSAQAYTDFLTFTAETDYFAYVYQYSVRDDRDWSDNDNVVYESVTTPETVTNFNDWVIKNLLYKINRRSRVSGVSNTAQPFGNKDFIGLAINSAGGTGTAIGTITCGTSIPIQTDGTNTVSITADRKLIAALARLIVQHAADANVTADVTGTSTIELIDLSTAGTVAAGAGNAAANVMVFIGLDQQTSTYFDDIEQTSVRVDANLGGGFRVGAAAVDKTDVAPREEIGSGRKWKIAERNSSLLRTHTMQNHPHGEYFSEGFSYVVPTTNYNAFILEFQDDEDTLTTHEVSPKKLVILTPATNTCVTVATAVTNLATTDPIPSTTTNTTMIASLEDIFGDWLQGCQAYNDFPVKGKATSTTYFL